MTSRPWAYILIEFPDAPGPDPSQPANAGRTKQGWEQMVSGNQWLGVPSFFDLMSLGTIDTSASRVFGPFPMAGLTFAQWTADHHPDRPNPMTDEEKLHRGDVIKFGRRSALAASGDEQLLDGFDHVCVIVNRTHDRGAAHGNVLLNSDATPADLLCHEMCHGFGVFESQLEQLPAGANRPSGEDYSDWYDSMGSGLGDKYSAAHNDFGAVGPGLSAMQMSLVGWLPDARVYSATQGKHRVTVNRLHDRGAAGFLAVELGLNRSHLVELRDRTGFDAALQPAVPTIHVRGLATLTRHWPYGPTATIGPPNEPMPELVAGPHGDGTLQAGDSVTVNTHPGRNWSRTSTTVTVVSIDPAGTNAVLDIDAPTPDPEPFLVNVVTVIGRGIAHGAGGVVMLGRRIFKVPPRHDDR